VIRLWKHFRREKALETQAEKDLRKKYNEFLSVLYENEYCLDLITRLEEKLYNNQLISFPYLKAMISNLSKHIALIVESLIQLSGGEHLELREKVMVLDRSISQSLTGRTVKVSTPLVIPLAEVKKDIADKVGNKMANLGDMINCCSLPIPGGFTATACAYTHLLDYNNLPEKIHDVLAHLDAEDGKQLMDAEKTIKKLFSEAIVPPEIEHAIRHQSEKYEEEKGRPVFWAVRSSAIGEDLAESSFAGQFSSVLNVRTDQLLEVYKEVAASKYNARVIVYRRMRNIRDDDVAMSVGFIEMIDPACSGVIYSLNPIESDQPEMVINAVWGVGELLVEGVISADVYVVGRSLGYPLLRMETAEKEIYLKRLPEGGLQQLPVAQDKIGKRCLNDDQLGRLAELAMRIEHHFGSPQDIEWCIDAEDNIFIVQSRPLRICKRAERKRPSRRVEAKIINDQAQPISHGIGSGTVIKATSVQDLPHRVPDGTILVLKNSSPRFISVLRKVAAVIVENGNWTDHMASVIREFSIPCLVRASGIFQELEDGQKITVDADEGIIYSGIITIPQGEWETLPQSCAYAQATTSHHLLEDMAKFIFPLHLTDPRQVTFNPESCQTWHDILRYCHETALNEMFALAGKNRLQSVKNIFKVTTELPVSLYVLDIMGNTIKGSRKSSISADLVASLPFQKLWQGMSDPDVNWHGPQQVIHATDLLSAMLRNPLSETEFLDTRSYAVVTQEYLNLSLSMGYHYIVLDCYLSSDTFNNYIALSFKGGAAAAEKRTLRVRFIGAVLGHMEFHVTTSGDFLKARLKSKTSEEFGKKLYTIGQLVGVSRFLDLAMSDELQVQELVNHFEAHDFSLGLSQ
jgi:pyruvate,water dikinase